MTTTPQTETGADGTQAVALQLSELVLKTARYDDMAAFYVLGHGPFYERTPDPDAPPRPAELVVFLKAAPDAVDYEGELAVVIGRCATDVSEAEAYDFVAGFTIVNDVSAHDVQKGRIPGRSADVTAAKSFDTFTPWGPPWSRSTNSPTPTTCACAPGSVASCARTRAPRSSSTLFQRSSPVSLGKRPSNPAT